MDVSQQSCRGVSTHAANTHIHIHTLCSLTFSLSSRARHRRQIQQMMVTMMQTARRMMMVRKRPKCVSHTDRFACGTGSSSAAAGFGGSGSTVIGKPNCSVTQQLTNVNTRRTRHDMQIYLTCNRKTTSSLTYGIKIFKNLESV